MTAIGCVQSRSAQGVRAMFVFLGLWHKECDRCLYSSRCDTRSASDVCVLRTDKHHRPADRLKECERCLYFSDCGTRSASDVCILPTVKPHRPADRLRECEQCMYSSDCLSNTTDPRRVLASLSQDFRRPLFTKGVCGGGSPCEGRVRDLKIDYHCQNIDHFGQNNRKHRRFGLVFVSRSTESVSPERPMAAVMMIGSVQSRSARRVRATHARVADVSVLSVKTECGVSYVRSAGEKVCAARAGKCCRKSECALSKLKRRYCIDRPLVSSPINF